MNTLEDVLTHSYAGWLTRIWLTRNWLTRKRLAALMLSFAVGLTACGGSGGDDDGPDAGAGDTPSTDDGGNTPNGDDNADRGDSGNGDDTDNSDDPAADEDPLVNSADIAADEIYARFEEAAFPGPDSYGQIDGLWLLYASGTKVTTSSGFDKTDHEHLAAELITIETFDTSGGVTIRMTGCKPWDQPPLETRQVVKTVDDRADAFMLSTDDLERLALTADFLNPGIVYGGIIEDEVSVRFEDNARLVFERAYSGAFTVFGGAGTANATYTARKISTDQALDLGTLTTDKHGEQAAECFAYSFITQDSETNPNDLRSNERILVTRESAPADRVWFAKEKHYVAVDDELRIDHSVQMNRFSTLVNLDADEGEIDAINVTLDAALNSSLVVSGFDIPDDAPEEATAASGSFNVYR